MRFRLVYQGLLPASGNSSKPDVIRDIRDEFDPQLEFLWKTHTALRELRQTAIVLKEPHAYSETPRSPFGIERDIVQYPAREEEVDLCATLKRGGKEYLPLVRKSLDLNCEIKILFLRKEDPGSLVMQGGDIDNRIKLLFDALRVPDADVAKKYPQKRDFTYCLLESDTLISGFAVETDRLLYPIEKRPYEAYLVLEVILRVLRIGSWNMCLAGN